MKLVMLATYDIKAHAFITPFFSQATAVALRDWSTACKDPEHAFARNPEDFQLYELGTFDQVSGMFDPNVPPLHVVSASSIVYPTQSVTAQQDWDDLKRRKANGEDAEQHGSPVQPGAEGGDPSIDV